MKFEEALLTGYLVKHLAPLTEADPVILAKYVVALLKKDKPIKELQKLCTDNLVDFLGSGANPFITKLFEELENGLFVKAGSGTLDAIQKSEPSQIAIEEENHTLKTLSPKEEHLSSSSEQSSDAEDIEGSDDDDRNHKHRRREARPNSSGTDTQEQHVRRPNRKRNKHCDHRQVFLDTEPQSSEGQKEYNPISGRNTLKFDKRRSDLAPLLRPPLDLGLRTRFGQPLRNEPGSYFDFSTSIGRPIGRGRGRSAVSWNQHDSRFNPHDRLDFASQMATQGPGHASLFVGTGLPNGASSQNSSWGGFGFIPGMSNGIMDPLNPLGLQGALRPTINSTLNLGIPRQRCRDFEERGFCLRGDMCPMEHGLNRIVVEDVQSLSQFNLPASVPSSHALGLQSVSGSIPSISLPSGQLSNTKSTLSKGNKSGGTDDVTKVHDIPSTSGAGDADVYDPDQPLWTNDCRDASALLRIPSPSVEDEPSWVDDSSARPSSRSDAMESEIPGRKIPGHNSSQNTNMSVWGRIDLGGKPDKGGRTPSITATGSPANETKEVDGETSNRTRLFNQGKGAGMTETGSKTIPGQPFTRLHTDATHKSGKAFPKAMRTLYINGIPQKSNRKDALFSHFQKFGEVIDIYIPLNSEKAFVQFSKREEAEAALKSPDAVMGNRFIKLSWANRDRILDDGESSGYLASVQSPSLVTTISSKQAVANGGKEALSIPARRSHLPAAEPPVPVDGPVKGLSTSALKAAPTVQKKMGNLELLEELRRKQESLAKKRDDFRRQLDKFEKHAISNKMGDVSGQAAKRQKTNAGSAAEKPATPRGLGQLPEKTLERRNSEGVLIRNGSKANSTSIQHSSTNTNQTSSLPVSLPNRYKLDNRSTSFRILPPLPSDFASVAVLKDHFSQYGIVATVELEHPSVSENQGVAPAENGSACVTFTSRHSAQKAYQAGRCWQGHNLQFEWVTVFMNSSSDCGIQETPSNLPSDGEKTDVHLACDSSSSLHADESTSSAIVADVGHNQDVDGTDCRPISPTQVSGRDVTN